MTVLQSAYDPTLDLPDIKGSTILADAKKRRQEAFKFESMLSEEEHMAKKLGGATADDILYYARRMKIMK